MTINNTISVGTVDREIIAAEPTRAQSQSMRYCTKVCRAHAKNFYYGLKLTTGPKREALYAIYAFMRACDDLADEVDEKDTIAQRADRIEDFRRQMQTVIDGGELPRDGNKPTKSIWPAFQYVIRSYPIQAEHLHAMLDGQRSDLSDQRLGTFDELYDYCYKVASVVGLVCISVWGTSGEPGIAKLAEYRGIAFQLTNILRDLKEDADRGRVYLPREDLERFNMAFGTKIEFEANDNFDRMMKFQIERARQYYELSENLEQYIEPSCQSTCWAMMRIYRGILEKIAENPRHVLSERVRLTPFQKSRIALAARLRKPTAPKPS